MPPQLRDASEASGRAGVNLSGHRPSYATTGIIIYILCAYCNIIRNLTMYMSYTTRYLTLSRAIDLQTHHT